jgi:hypothetical protein
MKSLVRILVAGFVIATAMAMLAIPAVMPVLPFVQDSGPHPADTVLIAQWREKRAAFEELATMLKDDPGLKRLWKDTSDPADTGLPPERLARYRALMREAGIISLSNQARDMRFVLSARGLSIAGSGKSVVFGDRDPYAKQIEGDLETAAQGERTGIFERPIEGRWRLQFDKS